MKYLKELFSTNNILKYSIILVLAIVVVLSTTLAYYSWGSSANTNISFDVIADSVYIEYDGGADITGANLFPTVWALNSTDENDGVIKKDITVRVEKESSSAKFNLYLDLKTLPDALKEESFKYALYQSSTEIKKGNFTETGVACSTNSTNHIVLLSEVTPTTTEITYTLYIWIDGENHTNPDTMMNQSFEFTLHAYGENVMERIPAATYLTSLYDNATKTSVTTAGGESINQATSVGLEEDSFGNIRYYGATPNNYVSFNDELWRIIGVFDVEDENGNTEKRVKIVRNESIGSYAYDNKPSGTGTSDNDYGSNDWTDARLMMLLNPGYETTSSLYAYEGSLYWNRKSGTCYAGSSEGTTSCDFTSTGLTTTAQSMIGQAKYYLGGNSTAAVYADDYYNFERGTNVYSGHATTWTGYVGIMYPSDYAYATDLSVCTKAGNNYNTDTTNCTGTDWLFNSAYQWLISPDSYNSYAAFRVDASGYVNYNYVYFARGVRPVLYLKSDISISGGEGTNTKPYTLESPPPSAVEKITTLYNGATKTSVTTAGGESINQATSVGLEEDSFGNIRYYGANPDNYVSFNNELWRIIGVFDVEDEIGTTEKRVKIVRNESIGSYAYDNKPSGTGTSDNDYGSNDWTDARLMMLLNPGYETTSSLYAYEGSLYWNRKSGTCYAGESEGTKSCDFTSTGLTTAAQSMIGHAKYYLGGSSSNSGLYADDYYNFERGTTVYSGHATTWTGFVGIMYPSDYAYATDLNVCTKDGNNYKTDITNCTGTDWLFNSGSQWLIFPHSSNSYAAFFVNSPWGSIENGSRAYTALEVRPVLYLKSNISISGGEGTSTNPYILS